MNNSKITTNEHGKFMTRNKEGKQFCFASAQFYKDSWSLSISTQRGCPLSCTFCDVPLFGFYGNAGLQFAINSTSDTQRNRMFNNASLSLQEISKLSTKLPTPLNSKYTLSFIVNKETVLDPATLNQLFSKDKFQIKIAPVHETKSTKQNQIKTLKENDTLSVINTFKQILEEQDWEVTTLL